MLKIQSYYVKLYFDLCNFSWSAVQLKPSILSYWFEMNIILQKQDPNYAINYILSSNLN